MRDPFYPPVDFEFIETQLKNTDKFQGQINVGQTKTFILKGAQAIHKRTILIRELNKGEVCFEQATGLAARFGFMGALLSWLEENKNWKEGAYKVPQNAPIGIENIQ